jgi:hypothetical protein
MSELDDAYDTAELTALRADAERLTRELGKSFVTIEETILRAEQAERERDEAIADNTALRAALELAQATAQEQWAEKQALTTTRLRPSLEWFALEMEATLRSNDNKGGWEDCRYEWLFGRLEEESKELLEALSPMKLDTTAENAWHEQACLAIGECADVANFAMMIADKLRLSLGQARAALVKEQSL